MFFQFRTLYILIILLVPSFMSAQNFELRRITMDQYIENYSDLAVQEMHRTGIPASIKMAQAILESGFGNSELATKANNHFGIKCHVGWTGPYMRMDDDEADECFRKYRKPEESFHDHSEFLTSRPRYSSLFELNPTDYKNWARGLQRAGYATNPNYANLLIRLIEQKDLHSLDSKSPDRPIARGTTQQSEEPQKKIEDFEGRIFTYNNIKTVVAQPGETFFDIAMLHGIRLPRLMRYNDIDPSQDYQLSPGERVYLQPKRRRGHERFHVSSDGQTMHEISQQQGIRLNTLLRRNRMDEDQEVKPGERLVTRGRRHETPAVLTEEEVIALRSNEVKTEERPTRENQPVRQIERKPEIFISITEPDASDERLVVSSSINNISIENSSQNDEINKDEEIESDVMSLHTSETGEPVSVRSEDLPQAERVEVSLQSVQRTNLPEFHTVTTGETLYAISVKYDIPVFEIQQLNNLQSNTLSVGQRLKLKSASISNTTSPNTATNAPVSQGIEATSRTTKTHRVEAGQTLFAISRLYGVSVDNLKKWNNTDGSNLSVGQQLIIGYDETISSANTLTPTQSPSASTPQFHYVEAGQTLFSIARLYGVTVAQIREWNSLNSNDLIIGQELVVKK